MILPYDINVPVWVHSIARTHIYEKILVRISGVIDYQSNCYAASLKCNTYPHNKVHGANIGPIWVLSAPDGPHVGPMNLAIRNAYADAPGVLCNLGYPSETHLKLKSRSPITSVSITQSPSNFAQITAVSPQ